MKRDTSSGPRSSLAASIPYLPLVILLAMVVRLAAYIVIAPGPPESDELSYLTMADNLARHGVLVDDLGMRAFFSAGYPILLAPFFALFGSGAATMLGVNLLLAGANCWIVWALARALGAERVVALLAALGFALWIPGIWNTTLAAKENLSTPLLCLLVLLTVQLASGDRRKRIVIFAGLVYGASLVTGASIVLVAAATGLGILIGAWRSYGAIAVRWLIFGAAALAILLPWFAVANATVGSPVLTTNSGFNLYIGNNPAATGEFVSIADTPVGPRWEAMHARLGELESSRELGRRARNWIVEHPASAFRLGAVKLWLFWRPNFPDSSDFVSSPTIALLRAAEVAQYLLILGFGLVGLARAPIAQRQRLVLAAAIGGFWLLHGAVYIIARYRDPIMPVLIVLGTIEAVALFKYMRFQRAR